MDGTSELVWTILSQHTSDLNAGRAFDALVVRYPSWREVVDAPTVELAETIRHGGLAKQKAPRIQQVLRTVEEKTGGYDISFLAEMPMEEAKAWLTALPGVGPKTAGVVLSFAIGMPAMAVDTHIHRVSRRLALIGPKVTADEAHEILERSIAPERVWGFHVYLITHGRQVCKAQRPLCRACVLAERCPSRPLYTEASAIPVTIEPDGTPQLDFKPL
ncbi:MAG: endonuclease III [Dehalococcoidia bacterium]